MKTPEENLKEMYMELERKNKSPVLEAFVSFFYKTVLLLIHLLVAIATSLLIVLGFVVLFKWTIGVIIG